MHRSSSPEMPALTVAAVSDSAAPLRPALVTAEINDTFRKVKTQILMHRVSRLPVMQRDRLLGVLHLRDIVAYLDQGLADVPVSQHLEVYEDNRCWGTITMSAAFFEAVAALRTKSALLVVDKGRPVALFTARTVADFTSSYARPFMSLEYLERLLRETLEGLPSEGKRELLLALGKSQDLQEYDVSRFDFATYHEAFSRMWPSLPLGDLDRLVVLRRLDEIRRVRNCLVHFRQEPRRLESAADDIDRFSQMLCGAMKLHFQPPSVQK